MGTCTSGEHINSTRSHVDRATSKYLLDRQTALRLDLLRASGVDGQVAFRRRWMNATRFDGARTSTFAFRPSTRLVAGQEARAPGGATGVRRAAPRLEGSRSHLHRDLAVHLAQIGHFLALLALNLVLLGFGTAVGFLGCDVLMDSVGRAEPLSGIQAAAMFLPETGHVGVAALSESPRLEVLFRFLIVSAVIIVTTTSAFTLLAMYKVWILQRVNQDLRVTMSATRRT